MNCLSELEYSIYLDGEASAQESRLIAAHLSDCKRCRALVDVLRSEDLLLSLLLEKRDEELAASTAGNSWVAWALGALLLVAMGWQALTSRLQAFDTPAAMGWLNPFNADFWWNLGSGAVFSLNELPGSVTAIFVTVGGGAALALLALGLWFMRRWLPHAAIPAMSLVVVLAMIAPGNALERRKATIVTVERGATVNDTLLVMAENADIDGVVNGDLIVFGRQVAVSGTVKGNIICFSRNLEMTGKVEGNIYNFTQMLRMQGEASRSLIGFTHTLQLPAQGHVGADLIAFASEANLEGMVGRDAITFSEEATLRGKIGRDFTAHADRVTLASPAQVSGDFTAVVRNKDRVHIGDGVVISGKTDVHTRVRPSRYSRLSFYVWRAITLVGAWLVGMLLLSLFPAAFAFIPRNSSELATRAGIGFLVCVATPVAAIVLCITLIGLPLGLITLGLWLVAIYISKIFVAATMARWAFQPGSTSPGAMALPLLASLLLIWIVTNLPYIGGLLGFLVVIAGLGIVFSWWRSSAGRQLSPQPAQ